ncbi:MAG TPA: TetR/AcrR family transcriptional regulator [Propionibacteriaceae bacterium]|jgi:AcrR family transcriptional regulator|nr:TetR/AcrR family transcriptional regulator [Propionibacteriaceae bacterium]
MLGETTSTWISDRRATARRKILDAAWQVTREQGLAALTLREVAARVGIRAPSLYSHFESKHAIYDAMFGESWTELLETSRRVTLPKTPRAALRVVAHTFFDFATADLARHQLMNQRIIPGFTPSAASYAPAVAALTELVEQLRTRGVDPSEADIDLYTALVGGLVDQQWANDPGGSRWARLLDRAIDMYADNLDLPLEEP